MCIETLDQLLADTFSIRLLEPIVETICVPKVKPKLALGRPSDLNLDINHFLSKRSNSVKRLSPISTKTTTGSSKGVASETPSSLPASKNALPPRPGKARINRVLLQKLELQEKQQAESKRREARLRHRSLQLKREMSLQKEKREEEEKEKKAKEEEARSINLQRQASERQ